MLRPLALDAALAFAGVAAAVTWLGFSQGGYYATSWGPASTVAAGISGAVLACGGGRRPGLAGWAFLGLLTAFVAWTAAGALRPGAATRVVPEVERAALYLTVAWVLLTGLRRAGAVSAALGGALTGSVVVVGAGLVSLLLPQHVGADACEMRLLFKPVGYANACGILAAFGAVLALGVTTYAASRFARAAAAAALVPLVVGLYLTGSRGAAAAAIGGLAVAFALDPRRRQVAATALVASPLPLLGVWLAGRSRVG